MDAGTGRFNRDHPGLYPAGFRQAQEGEGPMWRNPCAALVFARLFGALCAAGPSLSRILRKTAARIVRSLRQWRVAGVIAIT